MDNKQLLEQLGIDLKKINSDGKTLCPKCSHTRKKKNDPCLSVNVVEGVYQCWNDSCDFKGRVGGAAYEPKPKEYARPKFVNTTELSERAVKWFLGRGISPKTINTAKLTQGQSWMPQTQKEESTIQFNYFRDGELINVKYRTIDKHFRMVKDAELIFYNLDSIKDSDWCIITEGEIDALSFMEAGISEVISVPNGASKTGNANLEYLDNCIGYFENKKKIILATDGDEAGQALREELSRRLGKERCFKVDFGEFKDANDFLKAKGADKLKEVVAEKNLKPYPIDGIITADMMWDDMEDMFTNGLQRGKTTEVMTEFDELVSFVEGQLMVVTGIPNHGKSPFVLMIMACLSVKHGWKWGLFSPEHKPLKIFMSTLCELLLGKKMRKNIGFTAAEKELCRSFISDHFYFIEPEDENYSLENILELAKKLVTQKGIRGLLIDPWNKLEHNMEKGENETNYISRALDKIIKFDQRNDVFSIVVAHPTKIRKVFKSHLYEVPNLYDISGSSNWFNKPDIGVSFYRNFDTKRSEVYIQKFKYKHLGEQGKVELKYNMNNGRFVDKHHDWDNSNWLMPKSEQAKVEFATPTEEEKKIEFDAETEEPPF